MQDDINTKIADNKGLIFKQLHKFKLAKDQEAESIGYDALHKAVLTYDDSKGIQFSTYGSVCIYNALGCYVRTLNKQRQLEVLSYNSIAYSEDGVDHEFVDFFMATDDTEAAYVRNELHSIVRDVFDEEYNRLTNLNHMGIIDQWKESDFSASTVELARTTGNSQPYVSQVLNSFKFKLRKKLEEYYYG